MHLLFWRLGKSTLWLSIFVYHELAVNAPPRLSDGIEEVSQRPIRATWYTPLLPLHGVRMRCNF